MSCLFCKIIAREIPSSIVLETDDVLVFKDIHPQAPTHLLIIPKKHITNLFAVTNNDKPMLSEILFIAKQLAEDLQIREKGFKLTVSNGKNAGQEVDHLHFHFLSSKKH